MILLETRGIYLLFPATSVVFLILLKTIKAF